MNKEIRFIDSSYRELFKIPDNGIVKIILSDGEIMDRQCKYIDDYHFELMYSGKDYGEVYHICQFAEIMERNGHKYEPIFGRSYVLETPSADEQELVYRSSDKLDRGCIGWLRCDFGREGDRFYSTWTDDDKAYKTQEFKGELDEVINHFRMRSDTPILKSLADMSRICGSVPVLKLENGWTDMYMYKVQSDKHTYFIRCTPKNGDYNAYVYCYNTEQLERYKDVKFVEKTYGKIEHDKFFKTDKGFTERYYNPDVLAGGQIVCIDFDNDVIRKAAKNSRSASEFFGDIESMGYEYFIDAGTPEFRDSVKSLVEREAVFEGLTKKTMDGLKKEAGIKPHEMER